MKRRMHKGFTLVELLIVIGIIGLLSSMALIGGSEANNIASANKILEELKTISAAMNMYYTDNRATAETADATAIKTGIEPYMKSVTSILDTTGDANQGKYLITVNTDKTWWLTYTLPAADTKIGKILANKASQEGLVSEVGGAITDDNNSKLYKAEATVCMKAR